VKGFRDLGRESDPLVDGFIDPFPKIPIPLVGKFQGNDVIDSYDFGKAFAQESETHVATTTAVIG